MFILDKDSLISHWLPARQENAHFLLHTLSSWLSLLFCTIMHPQSPQHLVQCLDLKSRVTLNLLFVCPRDPGYRNIGTCHYAQRQEIIVLAPLASPGLTHHHILPESCLFFLPSFCPLQTFCTRGHPTQLKSNPQRAAQKKEEKAEEEHAISHDINIIC